MVKDNGVPLKNINELEVVNGQIWANIWLVREADGGNALEGHKQTCERWWRVDSRAIGGIIVMLCVSVALTLCIGAVHCRPLALRLSTPPPARWWPGWTRAA